MLGYLENGSEDLISHTRAFPLRRKVFSLHRKKWGGISVGALLKEGSSRGRQLRASVGSMKQHNQDILLAVEEIAILRNSRRFQVI
jgi:hypothetical protein